MYPPSSTPTSAMPILIARSRPLVSGGGGGGGATMTAVTGTPSTDVPQRHDSAGGVTRRPHAGHTRHITGDPGPAIYPKILT
jgi:hypothetical protein